MSLLQNITTTEGPASVILIRLMTGIVFLSEGIQKFLFPATLGVGRFAQIGIPTPDVLAPFVGIAETTCGALLLAGLFTRLASIVVVLDMVAALFAVKIPVLLSKGFWAFARESPLDISMVLAGIFLLIAGGGRVSIDARLSTPREKITARTRPR